MTVGRTLLRSMLVAAALVCGLQASQADEWLATSSLIGQSKYGANFQHYDYVNPNAPKGGTLNSVELGTFDSFNPFIARGTPAAGLNYQGGLLYQSLMAKSLDEGSVNHPEIAEAYKYPADFSSATYRLDPRARWHDGQPITVDDVVWSFNFLKKESPQFNHYFANVTDAVAVSDREVEFRFNQKGNRELPLIMADVVVLPKHWWEGTDASGKKRDITKPSLEIPLGSGPYKIESFKPGSEVVWRRVPDFWAADLGINVGRNNIDVRRYTYILDDNAAWQAFTKGGYEDIHSENSARLWMTRYNFPALGAGDVIKQEFKATSLASMQGFIMNTRRAKFQDRRVREALGYAFDFETLNRTQSFGLNTRANSYFMGSDLASSGLPQGKELEILNQYKDKLPAELFSKEFKPPVFDSPQAERQNLRKAIDLFAAAGWKIQNGQMTNEKSGEPFTIEILGYDQGAETTVNPFVTMLRKIGVTASFRIVDTSQYIARLNDFDYDMITSRLSQSDSPGNEQREYWSSKAADTPGSRNYSGIKNPVVDALVERVIFATDRDDLLAATHALDRVLLWNFYLVPQFTRSVVWLAYWDKFGIPENQPTYLGPDLDSWWIDPKKEAALAAKYKGLN